MLIILEIYKNISKFAKDLQNISNNSNSSSTYTIVICK